MDNLPVTALSAPGDTILDIRDGAFCMSGYIGEGNNGIRCLKPGEDPIKAIIEHTGPIDLNSGAHHIPHMP